ncbi:DnaJ-domain-containing protein [Suillus bovinus]|uniref:DnaJ-domain-containing protein n=1 Tax=Suillus bovinus TaxID=48563 RepID=UPI001B86CDC5|nr:DnaJ-domain-containing protein [Suillus bovinus]KAG2158242.1 DnaJ-domain-containing protein [Suillus bovinus]
MFKHSSLAEAYSTLGLQEGATLEEVKSAYRQHALRTHPDKNPDNADATAQFQAVGHAYTVLQRHLDPPTGSRRTHHYGMDDNDDEYDEYDNYDDYENYEDDPYTFEDEADRMAFFRFLFSQFVNGGRMRFKRPDPHRNYRRRSLSPETPEQYKARIERNRAEQVEAEKRRAERAAERKAFEARQRDKEREEAAKRQQAKVASKKAESVAARKRAAETAEAQQRRIQTIRSEAFSAARKGDAVKVRKAVWEENVDAAGGEIKPGCETYVKRPPEDLKETLLHIAARRGDVDLVEWLDAHSADPEERNAAGLSAFHVALQQGCIPIINHFFQSYDPKQDDDHSAIYSLSPSMSLLSLALESGQPEVVWMTLEKGLASIQDIGNAWTQVTSEQTNRPLFKKLPRDGVKFSEIQNLLMTFGGFTPPPTPKASSPKDTRHDSPSPLSPFAPDGSAKSRHQTRAKKLSVNQAHPNAQSAKLPHNSSPPAPSEPGKLHSRGPGGGRGQGRGRGRGRDVDVDVDVEPRSLLSDRIPLFRVLPGISISHFFHFILHSMTHNSPSHQVSS